MKAKKKKEKTFRLEHLFKEKQVGLDTAKVCLFFFLVKSRATILANQKRTNQPIKADT